MFKHSHNRAVLQIRVDTVTPLLIKAGDVGLDPTAASLACVRTRHATRGPTVYIPGSSLKGVVRSAAEAALRGLRLRGVPGPCDPLDQQCPCNAGRDESSAHTYQRQCAICRTFGSQRLKGRASPRDLFPWREGEDDAANAVAANSVELRNGVSIDRIKGSVKHGPFDQELVPSGVSFWGEIAFENYQVWQLGLLLQAFDDIDTGFVQLGSSKSRGLGVARVCILKLIHEQPARAGELPRGVGDIVDIAAARDYGLLPETALPSTPGERRGLHQRFVAAGTPAVDAWIAAARTALETLA